MLLQSIDDAVVVECNADGKVKLHQAVSTTGAGAAGGALWGGLIGLLFLVRRSDAPATSAPGAPPPA